MALFSPVRQAARSLVRTPVFAGISIVSVGVAIGLATSVFAVAHGLFFAPMPYPHPKRLVQIWQTQRPGSHQRSDYLTPQRMLAWVQRPMRYLTDVSGSGLMGDLVLEGNGAPTQVSVEPIVGDWFRTLGTSPALGRVLTPADERAGAPPAAVVSWWFWKQRLGGASDVLDRVLRLSGAAYTIVGVMPPSFEADEIVWVPEESLPAGHEAAAWAGVARLRPGTTQEEARQEIEQRSAAQVHADSARWGGFAATTTPMPRPNGSGDEQTLWILTGVVGAVLLIGLANLTTLFLARAQERSVTLAVRASLGATTWQLGRTLLAEALLVGAAGSVLGVLFAFLGKTAVASIVAMKHPPRLGLASVGTAALLGLLVAAAEGLEPLRQLRSLDVRDLLQRRAAGSTSTRGERRARDLLVGVEVALCVLLLVLVSVFGSAYWAYENADMGYDASRIVYASPDYERANMDWSEQWELARGIADRLTKEPEVAGVALWQLIDEKWPPRPEYDVVMDGPPRHLSELQKPVGCEEVDPGFFKAVGYRVLRGRTFTEADDAGSPPVTIVNRAAADDWWPGENPLGHRVKLGRNGEWMTVVGEIENAGLLGSGFLSREFWSLKSRRGVYVPQIYRPARQGASLPVGWEATGRVPEWGPEIAVRAVADPSLVERELRAAFTALDPGVRLQRSGNMYDLQMHAPEFTYFVNVPGRLIGASAILGLLLALLGVIGIVAEGVSRRTREIGVRMALGARPRDVLSTVARESVITALTGLGAGFAAVLLLRTVIARVFLKGNYMVNGLSLSLTDPRLMLSSAGVILAFVLVTSLVSAGRALRVQPSEALRSE